MAEAPRPALDPRIADMPECIRPVAVHLGYAFARDMVDNFPGAELYIPPILPEGHKLHALGEAAHQLCAIFAGNKIDVPLKLITAEARARRVRELAADGLTNSDIAMRVGLTRSGVKRILNAPGQAKPAKPARNKRDPRQMDIDDFLTP